MARNQIIKEELVYHISDKELLKTFACVVDGHDNSVKTVEQYEPLSNYTGWPDCYMSGKIF